jgi:predicted flap endonuclease-1-like 5' DNA nuclease
MAELIDIEGIGKHQAAKFAALGITSQEQLLAAAATPAGRAELSAKVDATTEQVLNWANRADLARVAGIGDQYADLLEEAGVDTVPELAQRNPEKLHSKLVELNEERIVVDQIPAATEVSRWVAEAKSLPRALHY